MVSADKVVALVSFESAPSKRLVQDSKDSGRAVDCTGGKKTRSVVIMNSGHVILSSLETEKLAGRINSEEDGEE
ncbi:MAG: DUF370 domain-containing protein [Clostridia bacterium]|nr:DUF370 domain-containing protein [Clostridia bacterium]